MEPAITDFFEERKKAKKKLDCPETWLPDAARRAAQMSLATHPCTFSHPRSRKNKNGYVTPVICNAKQYEDGLLRSGNASVETDALGNAASLDVYKFLTLELSDSRKLIEHIKEDSPIAVRLLTIENESYQTLKNGFLAMIEPENNKVFVTSSRIKQVYFPSEGAYHQLSLLTNSGMVYELKKRIDLLHFSETTKTIKNQKYTNQHHAGGFSELYNLTMIVYGGTKPQNISVLNNKNGGKAYLLLSLPPKLNKQTAFFPKKNFFKESLLYYKYRDVFNALHNVFKADDNNAGIRETRDNRLQEIIDRIIDRMWVIRALSTEQYRPDCSHLEKYQKIWLCHPFQQMRELEDHWLERVCEEISRWIVQTCKKLSGKYAIKLDDHFFMHVLSLVTANKEAFR